MLVIFFDFSLVHSRGLESLMKRICLKSFTKEMENSEIIPGSLLEIEILYNEKNALSVPDTSIMYEGNKKFIYKIEENNIVKKIEVKIGVRNEGNLEILNGLNKGDKVIAEGLTKVKPGMKVKPITKSQ